MLHLPAIRRIPVLHYSYQHSVWLAEWLFYFYFIFIFNFSDSNVCNQHTTVVLICTSLICNDNDNLFICLFAISIHFFGEVSV